MQNGEVLKQRLEEIGEELRAQIADYQAASAEDKSALESRLDELTEKQASLEDALKRTEKAKLPGAPKLGSGKDDFSMVRFLNVVSGRTRPDRNEGPEVECHEQMVKRLDAADPVFTRTVNAATDGAGAYLVPDNIAAGILAKVSAMSVFGRAGIQRLDGLVGNLSWVKGGSVTGYWVDTEAEDSITESTPTFTSITARPHPYAALTKVTYLMLQQSSTSMEQHITSLFSRDLALLKDLAFIQGSGSSGQPLGIRNKTGINTYDWSGTTLDWAGSGVNIPSRVRATIHAALEDDALAASMADWFWIMEPDAALAIANVTDGNERPIFVGEDDPILERLMRVPVYTTSQVATALDTDDVVTFVGDRQSVVDCNWGTLAFAASDSDDDDFKKARMTFRAIGVTDVAALEPLSIVDCLNVDETP